MLALRALGSCDAAACLLLPQLRALSMAASLANTGSATSLPILDDPSLPLPSFIQQQAKGSKRSAVPLQAALEEVKAAARRKFDETVDIAIRLGTDPKRGDQMVRGAVVLPFGTGKSVRVCVIAEGEAAEAARAAGAEVVGGQELISRIQEEGSSAIDFDRCISVPEMMPKLGRVARILGPRGLMPNPKLGTLVTNTAQAVQTIKQGQLEYRADKGAVLHAGVGKASFEVDSLLRNVGALTQAVLSARPKGLKGSGASGYLLNAHVSTTMGPSVPVTVPSLVEAAQAASKRR